MKKDFDFENDTLPLWAVAVLMLLAFSSYFWHAWVLLRLLEWFLVPTFGVNVSYGMSVGLILVRSLWTTNRSLFNIRGLNQKRVLFLLYGKELILLALGYFLQLILM